MLYPYLVRRTTYWNDSHETTRRVALWPRLVTSAAMQLLYHGETIDNRQLC